MSGRQRINGRTSRAESGLMDKRSVQEAVSAEFLSKKEPSEIVQPRSDEIFSVEMEHQRSSEEEVGDGVTPGMMESNGRNGRNGDRDSLKSETSKSRTSRISSAARFAAN